MLLFLHNFQLYGNVIYAFVSSAVRIILQMNQLFSLYKVFCINCELPLLIMLYTCYIDNKMKCITQFLRYFMLFSQYTDKEYSLLKVCSFSSGTRPHHICNAVGRCHITSKYITSDDICEYYFYNTDIHYVRRI